MNTWLTLFRISHALDDSKPLPPKLARAIARSGALRDLAEKFAAVDRMLRNSPVDASVSPTLHASIMRAVRASATAAVVERQPWWPRLIPASVLGVFALLGLLAAIHYSGQSNTDAHRVPVPSMASAGPALELGKSILPSLPVAVSAPLSEEMQRLNSDLARTEKFLLSSLP